MYGLALEKKRAILLANYIVKPEILCQAYAIRKQWKFKVCYPWERVISYFKFEVSTFKTKHSSKICRNLNHKFYKFYVKHLP